MARILVVEDNPTNLDLMVFLLKSFGHEVIIGRDGVEGIDAARRHHPDLVLMDIQMPGMDGLAAIRLIRADPEIPNIPIIALTALAMEGDRERCLAAGMDDYLSKPFSQQALADVLARWRAPRVPAQTAVPQTATDTSPAGEPHPSTTTAVDRTTWANITALQRPGHPNLLHKTIGLYLVSSQTQVDGIRHALQTQDLQTLLTAAHTLKSSSAMLGATRLAELAGQMETDCRTGQGTQARELFPLLEAEHQQVSAFLRQELLTSTEEAA